MSAQSPGPPFGSGAFMGKGAGRILLLRGGSTEGKEGRLLGRGNDKLSTLGHVQAQKAAELLMELEVGQLDGLAICTHLKLQVIIPLLTLQTCNTD